MLSVHTDLMFFTGYFFHSLYLLSGNSLVCLFYPKRVTHFTTVFSHPYSNRLLSIHNYFIRYFISKSNVQRLVIPLIANRATNKQLKTPGYSCRSKNDSHTINISDCIRIACIYPTDSIALKYISQSVTEWRWNTAFSAFNYSSVSTVWFGIIKLMHPSAPVPPFISIRSLYIYILYENYFKRYCSRRFLP